ncbi:MAG TPA: sodium:solute symporter family protein [Bryobacterales bacterium]|nr:sodium:solute symporter family protein [Bryobacterales bacterium]
MTLALVDYVILAIYFLFVLGIGYWLRRHVRSSEEFFLSGRSIPLWVTGLAFLAANLGAQEVIGMCASGAKYGIMTAHFYWVGAVPAMLFVGLFMMPFYYGSRARSVPEYLKLRFDEKTRTLNAVSFAVMTVFSSGISMYALGRLFQLLLNWSFTACVLLSAGIVLVYIFLGGLTASIYNEVLQFFLIVLGLSPLAIVGVARVGGWQGLRARLPAVMTSSWRYMENASQNPMGVDAFTMVAGLGFVLSFGYWCTDFLLVQRAMAAESMSAARRTPLVAAFPKMIMPFIVILPGLVALALTKMAGSGYALPVKASGVYDYDQAFPTLLAQFYPAGMLGVGVTALMASFMSGMAGNVTAFNTVWTYDIYEAHIRRGAADSHYLRVGRAATVAGVLISIGAAYLATIYNNIMDLLQLVFSFVNAPLFATFLLGMFWKRATGHGAFTGLVAGTAGAALTHGLTLAEGKGAWIAELHRFPSTMAQNFWIAIVAWTACFAVTIAVSLLTRPRPDAEMRGLVYGLTERPPSDARSWHERPVALALIVSVLLIALNWYFW